LTSTGKTVIGILAAVVLLGGGFVGYRLLTRQEGEPLLPDIPLVNDTAAPCPLTGVEAEDESLLDRRVLAVKIENSPEARPQIGLAEADIVYEQEAEGGISRFLVLYHCNDAERIGPIRSARPVDPAVLQQYGEPLFVHAGSAGQVPRLVEAAGIEEINCNFEEETCPRDESREAPHDVFTSTDALRDFNGDDGEAPGSIFQFAQDEPQNARRGRQVQLVFSPVAEVVWKYRNNQGEYLRFHGEEPHLTEDGEQITAANVVVMLVERELTSGVDVAGNRVPNFGVVGSGDLLVFRNGRLIEGTWERESEEEPTQLLDAQGEEIALAPGRTWIELFPTDAPAPPEF
jgi:Protein of unknown function (DUF3048) N-terminal domain/Protein of unknown function (DUF3048) C-terminal domain